MDQPKTLMLDPFDEKDQKEKELAEKKSQKPEVKVYCEFCKEETPLQKINNEILCAQCGLVQENLPHYVYNKYQDSKTNTAFPENANVSSNLNNTSLKDYTGKYVNMKIVRGLGKTFQKTKTLSCLEKSKYKGLAEIENLVKSLQIPYFLSEIVQDSFLKFNEKGLLKGRNIYALIVSLFIIEANNADVPLSISEVLKNSGISRKRFNKEYFHLYYLYKNPNSTSASGLKYLEKFLSYVKKWKNYEQFHKELKVALKKINFELLQGRDAIVSAGSIILHFLKYYEYPHVEVFLKNLILNRLTLKNYWNELITKEQYFKKFNK